MAGSSVELSNGRRFPTKSAAEGHFRALRDRYPPNTPITDPTDHDDLLALLERYDASIGDEPSKVGEGVRHFETRVNRTHGKQTIGFWVVRTDWSETDFSFIRAVAARSVPEMQRIFDACRTAIDDDMVEAKARFFSENFKESKTIFCPITDTALNRSNARADYSLTPFNHIVETFLKSRGWSPAEAFKLVSPSADAQVSASFIDPAIAADFRRFHHSIAKIRIVLKTATPSQIREKGESIVSEFLRFV
jgi:hypothetical protein